MENLTKLSKPLFIQDKFVSGVLVPNTREFITALKKFIIKLGELEKDELDEWDKELSSPEAHARYNAIIADADANDGWVSAKDVEKEFLIS